MVKINNKIKQALWQNWWKPDKIEKKLTNKRLDNFFEVEQNNWNQKQIRNKKKKRRIIYNVWNIVSINLFEIIKPEFSCIWWENQPPLGFVKIKVLIKEVLKTKSKTFKYLWQFIEVENYDYMFWWKKLTKQDIEKMDKWLEDNFWNQMILFKK